MLDKSTGEGVIRTKEKLDCELQKEHTFTIQAYDCGEGPDGANMKKSHKYVEFCAGPEKGLNPIQVLLQLFIVKETESCHSSP